MTLPSPSRRTFIKNLAAAASLPCLATTARAQAESESNRRADEPHTILNCNIRVPLPADEAAGRGWAARREACIAIIRARRPDLICLQEVIREPLRDLERALPEFASFGFAGPEMDARLVGYHGIAKNVILYSRDRYSMISAGGFWLSETPHLPGTMSWDSARARHVNWVRLQNGRSGAEFRLLTTHLDHQGQRAREEQMRMIVEESASYAPEFPQVLAGDFNANARNPVLRIATEDGWADTHAAIHGAADSGFSYHGFLGADYATKSPPEKQKGRIDFILARGPIRTLASELVRDRHEGRYPSDHYFLSARVAFV
ncbi:MAG: endonuclease/exonuclease/phosphatase family protein [Opitutaceae bacterium]